MDSFEGSGILLIQAKVSFQKTGSATQYLKCKDKYQCLVKFVVTMGSAKYTIEEAVQAIRFLLL